MLQLQNTLTAAEITEWDSTGNVILPGLFSWWWKLKLDGYPETCIADVVMLEFEMSATLIGDTPSPKSTTSSLIGDTTSTLMDEPAVLHSPKSTQHKTGKKHRHFARVFDYVKRIGGEHKVKSRVDTQYLPSVVIREATDEQPEATDATDDQPKATDATDVQPKAIDAKADQPKATATITADQPEQQWKSQNLKKDGAKNYTFKQHALE
ncbi:hypothetical protein MMC22_003068 [Lobaria immixta]|nr:hypothetical protein [Lobaria immixta]